MSDKKSLGTTLEVLCSSSNTKMFGISRLLDGDNNVIGEFKSIYPHNAPPIPYVENVKKRDEELTFYLMRSDETYIKIIFASGCNHIVYAETGKPVSIDDPNRKLGLYYTSSPMPQLQSAGRKRRQSKRQYNRRQSKRQSNRRQSNRR